MQTVHLLPQNTILWQNCNHSWHAQGLVPSLVQMTKTTVPELSQSSMLLVGLVLFDSSRIYIVVSASQASSKHLGKTVTTAAAANASDCMLC